LARAIVPLLSIPEVNNDAKVVTCARGGWFAAAGGLRRRELEVRFSLDLDDAVGWYGNFAVHRD
jgi:hypothetical protein